MSVNLECLPELFVLFLEEHGWLEFVLANGNPTALRLWTVNLNDSIFGSKGLNSSLVDYISWMSGTTLCTDNQAEIWHTISDEWKAFLKEWDSI